MNHLDTSKRLVRAASVAFAVVALSAWGASSALAAQPPEPRRIAFGQIGIAAGQSVQLNIVHTSDPPEPEKPIAVELKILDANGKTLASSVERVLPGHSASLTFQGPPEPDRTGRVSLRGLVSFADPPDPDRQGRARLVSTLEVFDNVTGRTSFVLNDPPEPDKAQR